MSKTKSRHAAQFHGRMARTMAKFHAASRPDPLKQGYRVEAVFAPFTPVLHEQHMPSRWKDSWPLYVADLSDTPHIEFVDVDEDFGLDASLTRLSSRQAVKLEFGRLTSGYREDAESRSHSRAKEPLKQLRRGSYRNIALSA